MKIQENFLTPNKFSRPQIPLKNVTKIAVHYVGNKGSSAIANRNYFEDLKEQIPDKSGKYCLNKDGTYLTYKGSKVKVRYVSSHFLVGLQGEIIQNIPLNEWSYCTNQANGYSISIECCHPDSTGKFTAETENSLAELCAYLLEKFHLTVNDIIRHYDVTGKQCPLYWSPTKYQSKEIADRRFNDFKDKVRKLMKADKPFKVRVLDPALNIRENPGTDHKIVGVISDKGIYTITETAKVGAVEWGKLKSGIGWISLGNKYAVKL